METVKLRIKEKKNLPKKNDLNSSKKKASLKKKILQNRLLLYQIVSTDITNLRISSNERGFKEKVNLFGRTLQMFQKCLPRTNESYESSFHNKPFRIRLQQAERTL